jgi:hypothetical protein
VGIKLIELLNWLECNSILDSEDEIGAITVDDKKELVTVVGKGLVKGELKLIGFSTPFDAVRSPVRQDLSNGSDVEDRLIKLLDDEPEEEVIKEEDIKKDEQIRDAGGKSEQDEKTEDRS